ncbi:MAG: serine hydrolase [Candidatus Aminicenantes bacterium]|nr:MAG: serine hydrolase [Candidatus Aminicenantes bacterium]
MKKRISVFIGFVLVFSIIGASTIAKSGDFDLEKTKKVLTGLIQKALKERGVPSISIALVKGDEIVWKAAFGYANVRTKTPATPETIYCTGSTFKAVTATALMQLAEKKKFKLMDPVNRYLGESNVQDRLQSEKPVTFRHMLSHWSGLTPGANTKPIWGRELPKTLDEFTSDLYSIRAPEKKWEYNNYAYGMAGLLVEKISGKEYEEYVVENILKPLGVETPHPVYPSPEMVELMALPYMPGRNKGKPRPVAQVHFDVYPAGDIYLTAEDMARFLGAHLNGGIFNGKRILSEESVKEMHTPQFGGTYGFGFFVKKEENGHTIISHGGGIPGQSSNMMGDVDARVGVYFMSNSGGPGSVAQAAIKLLRGEEYIPPEKQKFISVDQKVLNTYTGKYELMGERILDVTMEDQKLFIKVGGRPKSELLAVTKTKFFVKRTEYYVTFVVDEKGVVSHLKLEAVGQSMKAEKVK